MCLATSAVFAQSKFQPGYVVLPAGDTLRGEVEYSSAQLRAQRVRLRSADGGVKEYQPTEARGYGYTRGAHYDARRLPGQAGPTVFAEALVRGAATLYLRVDEYQAQRFYLHKPQDAALTELVSRDTVVERRVDGVLRNVKLRDTRYRTTLRQAFGDCEAVQARIEQAAFTETDLRRAFREYAACQTTAAGATPVEEAAQPRTRARLHFFGGAQRTKLNFGSESYWRNARFTSRVAPLLGAGIEIHPARFNEKLSLIPALYWTRVEVSQSFYSPPSPTTVPANTAVRSMVVYDAQFLRLPLVARWALSRNAVLRPFLQAGAEVSQVIKGRSSLEKEEIRSTGQIVRSSGLAFGDLRQTAFGATASAGLVSPSTGLSIELRYSWLDGIGQSPALSAPPRMWGVLLGYTLGR